MTKITAGRGTLNARDIGKGAVMAAIGAIIPIIYDSIDSGFLNFDWHHIWKLSAGAALTYLIKNFLTPSQVIVTDPVKVEAAKQGETITVTPKP